MEKLPKKFAEENKNQSCILSWKKKNQKYGFRKKIDIMQTRKRAEGLISNEMEGKKKIYCWKLKKKQKNPTNSRNSFEKAIVAFVDSI